MSQGVEVKGLRETVRNLEKFGVEVSDLKSAFQRIGGVVKSEAVSLTPVLTGRLAGSINLSKTKNKSVIRAGGASIPYAGVIHFGGYNNIEARPFLTDALSNKQTEVISLLESELQRLINTVS